MSKKDTRISLEDLQVTLGEIGVEFRLKIAGGKAQLSLSVEHLPEGIRINALAQIDKTFGGDGDWSFNLNFLSGEFSPHMAELLDHAQELGRDHPNNIAIASFSQEKQHPHFSLLVQRKVGKRNDPLLYAASVARLLHLAFGELASLHSPQTALGLKRYAAQPALRNL